MTYSVAVSGASGYAGGEILRILAAHPDVEIRTVTAHSNAGQPLIQHQPHLRSLAHLTLQDTTPEILAGHDIVFLALPHGQSGQYTDALADDAARHRRGRRPPARVAGGLGRFYGGAFHEPWTYGVPELLVGGGKQRENLVGATRIAAPGLQRLDREPEPRAGRRRRRHRPVRHRHRPRGRAVRRRQEPQDQPPGQRDPRLRQPVRRRRHAPAHPRDPAGARCGARVGRRPPAHRPARATRHPHLVHSRARADGAGHPRHHHCTDRARRDRCRDPRRVGVRLRRRDFVQLLPAGDSRAPPMSSARTPR